MLRACWEAITIPGAGAAEEKRVFKQVLDATSYESWLSCKGLWTQSYQKRTESDDKLFHAAGSDGRKMAADSYNHRGILRAGLECKVVQKICFQVLSKNLRTSLPLDSCILRPSTSSHQCLFPRPDETQDMRRTTECCVVV